jgi:predicted Zn-dependent protease
MIKSLILLFLFSSLFSQANANCETQNNLNLKLIVSMSDINTPNIWSDKVRNNLTYCVSTRFGQFHNDIVIAMIEATEKWSENAGIKFIYDSSQDKNCHKAKKTVFSVTKAVKRLPFSMKAFFPDTPREKRKIQINERYVNRTNWVYKTLIHEVGHVLGFRHEHIHPDNIERCFEDNRPIKPVTDYDPNSIMHYTRCGGINDGALSIEDRLGVQIVYPLKG